MPTFKDNFSTQANSYARFRPQYPDALYQFLSGLTAAHELAWDCGTGNGQAAVSLAKYYENVVATDPSPQQISHCFPHERILYRVEKAEQSSLAPGSADLLTIANALHWFERETFYTEARRVLKPGGIIAAWAYGLPEITPSIDKVIKQLHDEVLGDFWLPENKLVSDEYRELSFPFQLIDAPVFYFEKAFTADDMKGYLSTWSATQRYITARQQNPVDLVGDTLQSNWGNESRSIRWKVILKIGRI